MFSLVLNNYASVGISVQKSKIKNHMFCDKSQLLGTKDTLKVINNIYIYIDFFYIFTFLLTYSGGTYVIILIQIYIFHIHLLYRYIYNIKLTHTGQQTQLQQHQPPF